MSEEEVTAFEISTPAPLKRGFNNWIENYVDQFNAIQYFRPKVKYRASSDGFVSAISGGNSPAKGVQILIDEDDDEKWDLRARGVTHYDGAVCPVAKGQRWMVRDDDGAGRITIAWMPVGC